MSFIRCWLRSFTVATATAVLSADALWHIVDNFLGPIAVCVFWLASNCLWTCFIPQEVFSIIAFHRISHGSISHIHSELRVVISGLYRWRDPRFPAWRYSSILGESTSSSLFQGIVTTRRCWQLSIYWICVLRADVLVILWHSQYWLHRVLSPRLLGIYWLSMRDSLHNSEWSHDNGIAPRPWSVVHLLMQDDTLLSHFSGFNQE